MKEVIHTLGCDLREKKIFEKVVPYSHRIFRRAAVEWLVAMDQVGNFILQLISCLIFFTAHSSSQTSQVQEVD